LKDEIKKTSKKLKEFFIGHSKILKSNFKKNRAFLIF